MSEENQPNFLIIPPEKLSEETFQALVEEFILREGTDYGSVELSLEAKLSRARKQIDAGHVKIVYSPENESCTILKSSEIDL
ncbi:MAG: YheU family protein [Pseudomonadota bacterium]